MSDLYRCSICYDSFLKWYLYKLSLMLIFAWMHHEVNLSLQSKSWKQQGLIEAPFLGLNFLEFWAICHITLHFITDEHCYKYCCVYHQEVVISGFSVYLQSLTEEITFIPFDLPEILDQGIAQLLANHRLYK